MVKNYLTKFIFLTALFACLHTSAQVNDVLRASQFGGVTNVSFNPAIADNPFLVDINLVGVGLALENNYVGLNSKALTHPSLLNDPNFQSNQLKERLNGNPKAMFLGLQVQGPLSFMVSFGKNRNNKNAIAFSWHSNTVFNIDGVSQRFARIAYYGIGTKADSIQAFDYQNLTNQNLGIKLLSWADAGITYSRVVYDKGAHMVKAGVTGKAIVGLVGAYFSSKNIDYKFRNFDTLDIYKSDISYGHSAGVTETNILSNIIDGKSKVSFGADLGVVYEWRPDKDKYQYEMDCKQWYRNDVNKYKLAVGFSVMDIGRVVFARPNNVSSYYADIQGWVPGKAGIKDIATFDSVLHSKPNNFQTTNAGSFKMWLPIRFNLYVDYEIYRGLGVNLNTVISPNLTKDNNQVHYPTSVALTPRYDMKWVGVYIPLTYNQYGNFGAGFGLRAGPIFVTSSNIITALAGKYTYAMNVQAGVKITIPNFKQHDHDKDGVSNKKDKCKKLKGTCATQGCPDRDGDGVTDDVDQCPDIPGPPATHGCPDRDSDGVYDMNDSCPNTPGPAALHGCPDTDGDGIIDKNDECPTQAGPAETHGCPDRDKDGVPDKDDACPDLAGDKAHKGCPDTDGDGLYDNEDNCPTVKGPVENVGCPWPDTDGDGVIDREDSCVTVPGVPENHGCPVLTKKEAETVKYAFDNLEFEFAKDVIKTKSHPSLDKLALLLQEKGYGLKIEGHTDSIGTPERNMNLSIRRAEAVKNYLVGKGVIESRLETAGYGQTRPIATNKTEAGRQKNRRVEMTIVYK